VAAGLLLAVAGETDVDRQLACGRELRRRLGEHVELALVVDDAACVQPLAALLQGERIRLPELERVGRLDVDVPVDEHRRSRAVRGDEVAEDQRLCVGRDDLGRAAGNADEAGQPFRRPRHVGLALGIGADARDRQQLGELVEPGLGHGARVYANEAKT
jgi:hypothetical protein